VSSIETLFAGVTDAVNVGVAGFAGPLAARGVRVTQLDWRPPAGGDEVLGLKLAGLVDHPLVEAANHEAVARMLDARALWVDVRTAGEVLPALAEERLLLHAGPPIAWEDMCGPMRAGVVGAALLEGWAPDPEAAERLAAGGDIRFAPCHHHDAVGPMAGIISASMPVIVVEDPASGKRAYSNLNEGAGRCLRYGALGDDVMARLRWMNDRLGPSLRAALHALDEPVDLKALTAQALQMGDECHSRNVAASSLLTRLIAPALARHESLGGVEVLEFLRTNDYWFLNFSMAASKLCTTAGHGVEASTIVTAFARNGVRVGIRVSGTSDSWFTAPAAEVDGLYFPGFGPQDANPDIGDSAIAETYGLGGFSLAAAPAIVGFVGGTAADAIRASEEMATITAARHREYRLPALGFAGSPLGIDVRKVLDTGTEPLITTGIAHREPGIGQIGAGLTRAPMACFLQALHAFEAPAAEAARA
jgi:hypothetical protein